MTLTNIHYGAVDGKRDDVLERRPAGHSLQQATSRPHGSMLSWTCGTVAGLAGQLSG